MYHSGRKIFVAGGSGLVGTNLTKSLLDLNVDVRSSYYSTKPKYMREVYNRYDLTNFDDCLAAVDSVNDVYICAAKTFGSAMMRKHPTASLLPNLNIIAGLFEASARKKVEKILFISSTTLYHQTNHPIKETELDLNKQPFPLYRGVGWLNRYFEELANLYKEKYNIEVCIVRPTSIYGPHDCFDDDKSHVIPALIKRALKKEDPFAIWGTGKAERDFIYVEDLVTDIITIFNNYTGVEPLNLGCGETIDVKSAAEVILKVCGHDVEPIFDTTKEEAIPYRGVDMSRFKEIVGSFKRTSFYDGIMKTVNWYNSL